MVQCLAPEPGVPDRSVQQSSARSPAEWLPFRHYVRVRRRGPRPPADIGFAVRLEFATPLSGPIAIGYGSHFGLGLFAGARG